MADTWEEVGLIADTLDNALAFAKLPVPDAQKVDALLSMAKDARDRLRAVVVRESGENPWEFHPEDE